MLHHIYVRQLHAPPYTKYIISTGKCTRSCANIMQHLTAVNQIKRDYYFHKRCCLHALFSRFHTCCNQFRDYRGLMKTLVYPHGQSLLCNTHKFLVTRILKNARTSYCRRPRKEANDSFADKVSPAFAFNDCAERA